MVASKVVQLPRGLHDVGCGASLRSEPHTAPSVSMSDSPRDDYGRQHEPVRNKTGCELWQKPRGACKTSKKRISGVRVEDEKRAQPQQYAEGEECAGGDTRAAQEGPKAMPHMIRVEGGGIKANTVAARFDQHRRVKNCERERSSADAPSFFILRLLRGYFSCRNVTQQQLSVA